MSKFRGKLVETREVLFAYALSLTKNREKAEDFVSSTILKALEYEDRYVEEGFFKAWLMRIMKNEMYSSGRNKSRHEKFIVKSQASMSSVTEASQEGSIIIKEVGDAVDRLHASQRDVLLKIATGMSYDEVAVDLGISVGTVKSRLWRSKASVVRELENKDAILKQPKDQKLGLQDSEKIEKAAPAILKQKSAINVSIRKGPPPNPSSTRQQMLAKRQRLEELRDLGVKIRGWPPGVPRKGYVKKVVSLICETCLGPRSQFSAKQCRSCYTSKSSKSMAP